MSDVLTFIVVGVVAGAIYSLAGVGLVVTYKASGVFNFAHGSLATVAAYTFYTLYVQHGMPWPAAAAISVLGVGIILGLILEVLARRFALTSLVWQIVSTVGLLLIVESACTLIYGASSLTVPHFLPLEKFDFFGAEVSYEQLIIVCFSLVATVILYCFFRYSRTGWAMRAVVDDPDLLALSGASPTRVRRYAWITGSTFAAASGVLLVPSVGLLPATLTLLAVQAFGAAAIGRFSSLPLTWVGGVAIGVCASVATKYFSATSVLGGLPVSLPFLVLFIVLVVMRKRPATSASNAVRIRHSRMRPATLRTQAMFAVPVLAVLAFVPDFAGFHLQQWTLALSVAVLFMSLGLLVHLSGQVSLCHIGFAAIGAVAFSKLLTGPHIPWPVALVVAGLCVVPFGALVAIPAIRHGGLYIALATLGFGLLLQNMFYTSNFMFGPSFTGLTVPRPHLSWLDVSSDTGFYYVVLVTAIIVGIFVDILTRARLGRLLMGLADSPRGISASGANVAVTRLAAFGISAFLAGIAGALMGSSLTYVSGDNFDPTLSLVYVAVMMVTIGPAPWYALFCGIGISLIPGYISSSAGPYYLDLLFGIVAILGGMGLQGGVPAPVHALLSRAGLLRAPQPAAQAESAVVQPERVTLSTGAGSRDAEAAGIPRQGGGMLATGLRVIFGGVTALDGVTVAAAAGKITGLIGPNGAGKTTMFNVCSGLVAPAAGKVVLHGRDLAGIGSSRRARLGLGRTFQLPELFDSLTVRENVSSGCEAGMAGAHLFWQIFARPREKGLISHRAGEAMELCGIGDIAGELVGSLSSGQRRLVELARCLAGPFDVFLLDEPSAGLDRTETARFGDVLREVLRRRGCGILLIEHDMDLVMDLCDYIYVIDFGKPIFEGTPAEVQTSLEVRAAYLGEPVA